MAVTNTDRGYAWGTQGDYQTPKPLGANSLRGIICTDNNALDYEPKTANDEEWSTQSDWLTDEWIEAHETKVSHTMPGFIEEIVRPIKLAMGGYAPFVPAGASAAKGHRITPQDPAVSRQLQAVSYGEKFGTPWSKYMPSALCEGFTLKGSELGVLTLDFTLQGSGRLIYPSGINWATHVQKPTNLHKLFNTQVGIVAADASNNGGNTDVDYGCKYRGFTLQYKNTFALEAGYQPGCSQYQESGKRSSGVVRSELIFVKREIMFDFEVDMKEDSGELDAVVKQKPLDLTLNINEELIEPLIPRSLKALMPRVKYSARKLGEGGGIKRFAISARPQWDVSVNKILTIEVVNEVASYATW